VAVVFDHRPIPGVNRNGPSCGSLKSRFTLQKIDPTVLAVTTSPSGEWPAAMRGRDTQWRASHARQSSGGSARDPPGHPLPTLRRQSRRGQPKLQRKTIRLTPMLSSISMNSHELITAGQSVEPHHRQHLPQRDAHHRPRTCRWNDSHRFFPGISVPSVCPRKPRRARPPDPFRGTTSPRTNRCAYPRPQSTASMRRLVAASGSRGT
jgi:hypothetical protein